MTELLFSKDCYLKEFDAVRVSLIEDSPAIVIPAPTDHIQLDRTAFYYTSGGQPCDLGKIIANGQEYNVIDVFRDKATGKIFHKLDRLFDNKIREVHGIIDWNRRYMHMRHHTALHLLSKVVLDEFGNFVTSSQIYADRARIDFDFNESISAEKISLLVQKTNAAISKNLPVSISFMPREEALGIPDLIRTAVNLVPESVKTVRIITVEGFDMQACGGTHVKNTGEIGGIKITKTESKGAARKRIEICLI
ncbi:MAG: alanyl-tRNA editing protein [Candidatus Micrarchaeota archaeon]